MPGKHTRSRTARDKNILAFCNAADTINSNNLALRISLDEGRSWLKNFFVDAATRPGKNIDYTAYSEITQVSKTKVTILYKRNNYYKIVFTVVDIND